MVDQCVSCALRYHSVRIRALSVPETRVSLQDCLAKAKLPKSDKAFTCPECADMDNNIYSLVKDYLRGSDEEFRLAFLAASMMHLLGHARMMATIEQIEHEDDQLAGEHSLGT